MAEESTTENTTQTGRVVLVSGGSRGLGLGIVRYLLAAGYRVATFSRSRTEAVDTIQGDDEAVDRFLFRCVDAQDNVALRAFVDETHAHFGEIFGLVNNAGIAHDGVLAMMPVSRIEQMLDVNLKAALILAKECSRYMLDQNEGVIINISSIIGSRGFSGLSAYAATKAGMDGMTRALARELGRRNIRVNALAPGYLDTEMSHGLSAQQRGQIVRRTPLGRLGRVDDVAPWIKFLLHEDSRFMTGQVLILDGGATV